MSRAALRSYQVLVTWGHTEGLILTYACHSWFKRIQMPVLRGEPSVPGGGGEIHVSSLMGVSAAAVLWFLWGPERVPFWWIRLLEEGWPPNGDKGSHLSPALPVPRKKMPATGIVAIWLAGCLFGISPPGPFEAILRPIW